MGNTEWLAAPIVFLVSRQSVSDRRSHWLVFYVVPHANTLEWPSERLKKAVFWGAYLYFPFFISLPSESEVTQSCLTLCDPVDCSPPGSSIHGILQARILEWVAISFSRESSKPSDGTQVSCTADRFFTSGRAVHCPALRHTPLGGAYFCQHLEVEVREGRLGLLLVWTAPKDCGRCHGGTQPVAKPSPSPPFAEPSA